MVDEFAKIIENEEIKFKYAKGMRDVIGNEIHTYHEIFFYIGGDAKIITETGTKKLLPYTTVIIPKETFHCFVVSGDEKDYCRCVFNFENVSELNAIISQKMNRFFLTRNSEITELFTKLRDIPDAQLQKNEKNILIKSFLAQILIYLKEQDNSSLKYNISPITEKIIEYVKNNIEKTLTLTVIADNFHVSESHIAHIFKKDLHIPIHKYILECRLVLANRKIKNSVNPMQAAVECGFRDYSGFYRQYKKMFGIPPSKSKEKQP
ncbi:MAG: AraC family transcriptional regulator [Clostridia bacterium]|nr:AraC family transcriptional regulator [Clostridia bacterium]